MDRERVDREGERGWLERGREGGERYKGPDKEAR